MKISLIIPCYNCEKKIENTVASVLAQKTTVDYEIVLVDDGCKDSTPEIIDRLASEHDNIKVFHKENGGCIAAWKDGVRIASGDHLAFVDNDDYVDDYLFEGVKPVIEEYDPDMVCYGYIMEYNTGERIKSPNGVKPGYYTRQMLEEEVFPVLYSNKDTSQYTIINSRWTKIYRKSFFEKMMVEVPEDIWIGEDLVTNFVALNNTNSIYCMEDFFPVHYCRSNESMIGKYDPTIFDGIYHCFDAMYDIANRHGYKHLEQINIEYFSTIMLYIKKEICRNPNGYFAIKKRILEVTKGERFTKLKSEISLDYFNTKYKLFCKAICNDWILLAYLITKITADIKGRNV